MSPPNRLGRKRSRHHDAARVRAPEHRQTMEFMLREAKKRIEAGDFPACWICGKRIDHGYDPKAGRMAILTSLSVDHLRPIDPDDPWSLDASNCRLAHRGCNDRRGRTTAPAPIPPVMENSRW